MEVTVMWMLLILGLCSRVQLVCIPGSVSSQPAGTVSCTTTARDITGSIANVLCPAGCLKIRKCIWGTDVYTDDSSICRAAIHDGLITNDGGQVTVQKTLGQATYSGSSRHGITTNSNGAWPGSFVLSVNPVTPETTPSPSVTASCTTTARDITASSADVFCPAGCQTTGQSVWGTDVYTDDSSICRAAIHAGLISNNGGTVTVQKTSGQSSYSGSTQNGITTTDYGSWTGSFIFVNSQSAVPASCTTTARDISGSSANFVCPPGCLTNGGSIWGTDVYTDDSSLCRAAIHAGIIPNDGGQITVQKIPGQASYSGSTRNGITTSSYGPWTGSFIFANSAMPVTPEPVGDITQRPSVTASCTTAARDITGSSADVSCPAGCQTDGGNVWGTDVYTDDSSICRAAINAGLISNNGGQVTVQKTSGQSSYSGSTRNGITTNSYGSWPASFVFSNSPSAAMATCTTRAKDISGTSAEFVCPPGCLTNGGSIWGTDVYTDDSSICRAAIHAGIIPDDGGQIIVQKIPGQASYSGSTRNGITTSSYGPWTGSFIFTHYASPVTPEPVGDITPTPSVQASCSTSARDLQQSSSVVQCPPGCLANGGSVWGTNIYTDDSSICRAAIHAGVLTNNGGQMRVNKIPGQAAYTGSTMNGITTSSYGAWTGSFVLQND